MADLTPWLDRTPARLLAGRSGTSYTTATQLALRVDHAAAVDAVRAEVDADFLDRFSLPELCTEARDKAEFLLRPDLGRRLSPESLETLRRLGISGATLQVVVGDGLSSSAVIKQVPTLLPLLEAGAGTRGWSYGRPFFVRRCRVGVLNDVGEALDPSVVVLLIGERPGLATADSLSAYFGYRPRRDHTDAQRNLISNIHARGIPTEDAAARIFALVDQILQRRISGVAVKEQPLPRLS